MPNSLPAPGTGGESSNTPPVNNGQSELTYEMKAALIARAKDILAGRI